MSEDLQAQHVLSAGQLGLASLGSIRHLVGNTATKLTRPANKSVLVLNVEVGNFRIKLGDYASIGDELVVNGAFTTDVSWTKGTGWTIAATVADSDGTQTADSDIEQDLAALTLAQGDMYVVTYTVSSYSAGNVAAVVGGTEGTDVGANGAVTQYILAGATQVVALRADATFVGKVDGFSVKKAALRYVAPVTNDVGYGSVKLRTDVPIAYTAPSEVTVIGSGASDVLTYYWQ